MGFPKRIGTSAGARPTRKQQVVALCIEAIGPLYAGKKNSGYSTVLYGYSLREPIAAARVTSRRSAAKAEELDVTLQVLREDLVNVFLLEDRLADLAEQLERSVE
jgi:hypothetical protein